MDDKTLIHWGVLGMKWGVRRTKRYSSAITDRGIKDAAAKKARNENPNRLQKFVNKLREKRWERHAQSPELYVRSYNKAAARMNATEITRINNKKEYKNKNFNLPQNKKLYDKYKKEYENTFTKILEEEANRTLGPSPINNRTLNIDSTPDGNLLFSFSDLDHSTIDDIKFIAAVDENGSITSIKVDVPVDLIHVDKLGSSLTHSELVASEEFVKNFSSMKVKQF